MEPSPSASVSDTEEEKESDEENNFTKNSHISNIEIESDNKQPVKKKTSEFLSSNLKE